MSAAWVCELHDLATTNDCPRCDDEQIAGLESDQKLPVCHKCKRTLREGESAWVADWKVLDVLDETATFRTETRYTCDDCEANQ